MVVQLQTDIANWQSANFGEHNPRYALLGLLEESGELCHAVLKAVQQIRGSLDTHIQEMQDAIGDIFIYLVDFMRRSTIGILYFKDDFFPKTAPQYAQNSNWIQGLEKPAVDVAKAVNALSNAFEPYFYMPFLAWAEMHQEFRFHCLNILISMANFCSLAGFDMLKDCILPTWEGIVSKRDWVKDPLNGKAS